MSPETPKKSESIIKNVDKAWTDNNRRLLEAELADDNNKEVEVVNGKKQQRAIHLRIRTGEEEKPWPVYRIKTDVLKFNFGNVRLKKYRENIKKKLNTEQLDPQDPVHENAIKDILLNTKPYSAISVASLKESLADPKEGQSDPCLVTPDGILLNGNRRLAVFKDFFENGFRSKKEPPNHINPNVASWKRILVAPIPELTAEEFRSLEKKLQQKKSTKEPYGDVNEMIDIRDSFRLTFGDGTVINRDYEADEANGGATDAEKKLLELEFEELDEKQITFKWLCESVAVINLIDEHLTSRGKAGQYDEVEDKQKFQGGLTNFYDLHDYKAKLTAKDDGSDPFYVHKRQLATRTAFKGGKVDYRWVRAERIMVTPKNKRSADYQGLPCEDLYDAMCLNSPIIQNYEKIMQMDEDERKRYLDDPVVIAKESQLMKNTYEALEKSKVGPVNIYKQILKELEESIKKNDLKGLGNDAEFVELTDKIKAKLDEHITLSKSP